MTIIEEALKKYKAATIELIYDVKRGDYEKIQLLFSTREELLQGLKDADFDRKDFKRILAQEGVIETDGELRRAIDDRKKQVVARMASSSNVNKAVVNYRKNQKEIDVNIFNETV